MVNSCKVDEATDMLKKAVELVLMGGLPFNLFVKVGTKCIPLASFANELRSCFAPFISTSHKLGGKYLNE